MIEKKLRKYILPNVLAMVGMSWYILADTFFISVAAGADGITALNLVLPIFGLIFAIGAMIGIGSATKYSLVKDFDKKRADEYFSNGIISTIIIGLIFVVLGILASHKILQFMGADSDIMSVGLPYLKIILGFTPFFMTNYVLTAFVRNDGAPNIAMAATLISGISNIIFDYIFMFPMKMGMVGAALATGVSPIVSMAICMLHYLSEKNTIKFIKKLPSLKMLIDSCKLGIVAFVGEISSGITTMIFNFLLLDIGGNIAVAAYGIIANIAIVGTSLFNGVSQGLQPLASQMHGRQEREAELRIYKHSIKIVLIIAALLVGYILIFAENVVAIFNSENSAELAKYAERGIRLYFMGFLFASVNIIKSGFYSATDMAKESSFIAISRGVVAIVVFAFVLSKFFGIFGVWLAFPVSEIFTLLLAKVIISGGLKG